MKKIKSEHVTMTKYWSYNIFSNEKRLKYNLILKYFRKLINKYFLNPLGFKLSRINKLKILPQVSGISGQLISKRNLLITSFIHNYFSEYNIIITEQEINKNIIEYELILENVPISDLSGGMGYNKGLITYILLNYINPIKCIESGVWRGFTTYIMDKVTSVNSKIYCFDINLEELEYKSTKAKYFESDITENNTLFQDEKIDLALFDDHFSHFDRINFCLINEIHHIILDDDVSILQLHSDGWPPIPTASMVFNYIDSAHEFEWSNNTKKAKANIQNIETKSITDNYIRIPYPDLYKFTGYKNSTPTTFLINKKELPYKKI